MADSAVPPLARLSTSDTTNHPSFDPTMKSPAKGRDEPGTCRICRGEGSEEEPLFYPCKCSGSIRFVHQECLMDWLSHSQRKHCEVCKTPFHFTKLYSPNMPSKLPASVFIQKAVLHVLGHLGSWLRGLLVGSIWLVCLPWIMRYVWRVMFWIGDAGWARDSQYLLPLMSTGLDKSDSVLAASPLDPNLTAATGQSRSFRATHSQPESAHHDTLVYQFVEGLWNTLTAPLRRSLDSKANLTAADPVALRMLEQRQSSILSDLEVLKHLSPSHRVNRFIMDVLEGQIITLSVVIVCILIFLIREWVVQQQPVVDLAADDADNALAQAGGEAQNENDLAPVLPQPDDNDVLPDTATEESTEAAEIPSHPTNNEDNEDPVFPGGMFTRLNSMSEQYANCEDLMGGESLQLNTLKERLEKHRNDLNTFRADLEQIGDGRPLPTWNELPAQIAETETRLKNLQEMLEKGNRIRNNIEESDTVDTSIRAQSTPRPNMPSRAQSSIATDIARNIEEGEVDDDSSAVQNEDEPRSRQSSSQDGDDSNGSWQNISNNSRHTKVSPSTGSNEPGPSRPLPSSDNAADVSMDGPSEARDDLSWVSTIDSAEQQARDEPDLGENPFAPAEEANQVNNRDEGRIDTTTVEPVSAENFWDRMYNWFWGDIIPGNPARARARDEDDIDEDVEQIVEDFGDEEPFVPFADAQPVQGMHQPPAREPEVPPPPPLAGAGGADAGFLDAEAMDDAEDLEGILELIGMQGPIVGLIQNAIFSCILISLSIAACVFVPYVWGKLVLLHVAEPSLFYKVPLKTATVIADLAIDAALTTGGFLLYAVFQIYKLCLSLFNVSVTERRSYQVVMDAQRVAKGALGRLVGGIAATNDIEAGDFLYLSMACHAALHVVEESISDQAEWSKDSFRAILGGVASLSTGSLDQFLVEAATNLVKKANCGIEATFSTLNTFWSTGSLPISMGTQLIVPDDPMLTYWSARDRMLAVLTGYAAVALICATYSKVAPLSSGQRGRRIETYIVDACSQAGGVLKVILIISIEMIAFPLFCGFLLDFALMPLFDGASFSSRLTFTLASPWTSGFVHWFVGTCYMFHFALFVSMCRRIMRSGVLYFIRDPDDPTFHPVRDVLERNVITQLRKIAFSAIVYGALIVVCLGGVVWGMWLVTTNVLPIHWSSTGSNIEFPLDILFYNFLTPFVVHYARPSDGINAMYAWWFRRVARVLRLSDFLFKESNLDEEGHWVRKSWKAWIMQKTDKTQTIRRIDDASIRKKGSTAASQSTENNLDSDVQFVKDGRFVRAPASDQLRIPKGTTVFVGVDSNNVRLDGQADDEGIHASNSPMITKVYIPPWFRVRIGFFVVAVWLFAAATGICVTIVPLLVGRYALSHVFGPEETINDIYAFSLGVYTLGGLLYAGIRYRKILEWAQHTFMPTDQGFRLIYALGRGIKRVASFLYVYAALAIGLPLMNAVLLEIYILMPAHLLFDGLEHHVMHIIQDWTLGILYVKIGMRIFLSDPESRPSRAVKTVFQNGYLHPSAAHATRFFILPALMLFALLMGVPFVSARAVNESWNRGAEEDVKIRTMRLAYPVASAVVALVLVGRKVDKAMGTWRKRIKDEVYLVGERLHNFGDIGRRGGKERVV